MPIHPELLPLYPKDWKEISHYVRFTREKGICQKCGRPHGDVIHRLPDGRWFNRIENCWKDSHGKNAVWPNIFEYSTIKNTKVILATAHMEHDPRILGNEQYDKLAAWCQRCHLEYDRPFHNKRRKITYRSKLAIGDLFTGYYNQSRLEFTKL